MASVSSGIISPACRATIVAPRIRSVPARTWTLTKPSVSPSRTARSTSRELLDERADRDAARGRLALVEPDVRDLRVGVRAPGHGERARAGPAEEERVLDDDARLAVGGVRELVRRAHVAGGVDPRVRRPQPVVDAHARARVVGDARPPRGRAPRRWARGRRRRGSRRPRVARRRRRARHVDHPLGAGALDALDRAPEHAASTPSRDSARATRSRGIRGPRGGRICALGLEQRHLRAEAARRPARARSRSGRRRSRRAGAAARSGRRRSRS